MGKLYGEAETFKGIAEKLLGVYHSELAAARILYVGVSEASKKGGRPVLGKVRKISGALEYLLNADFIIEIAFNEFNELSEAARNALADHLLERCFGEEDEKTGEMKWSVREPDVQEFQSILNRHGAWNEGLAGFVSIAQTIQIDSLVNSVVDEVEESAGLVN